MYSDLRGGHPWSCCCRERDGLRLDCPEMLIVASSNKGDSASWSREGSLNTAGHGLVLKKGVRMKRGYDSIHARYNRELAETYWLLGHPKPLWNRKVQ